MNTLNVQLTNNQRLYVKTTGDEYVVVGGLTKAEPSWKAEVKTYSTFEMEGWSDSEKTGMALSFAFEGYELPGDAGNDAIVAAIPKMGSAGNLDFKYLFPSGESMTFSGCVEGNYGGGSTNDLSPLSGTITCKGKPEWQEAE